MALLLLGCSDSQAGPGADGAPTAPDAPLGDCTSAGRECQPPFVCRLSPETQAMECISPADFQPTCHGTPAGQEVPFQPAPGGVAVHWALSPGCVATSYGPGLEPRAAEIAQAVKLWNDVACSRLCLDPPTLAATSPDLYLAERRLHLQLVQDPVFSSPAVTTVNVEPDTGRIFTVVGTIDAQRLDQLSARTFAVLVGLGIGLSSTAPGVDSMLSLDSTELQPTAADESALCTLYGDPSYCGD